MRMAVRPCQTVPPHQHVPSSCIAAMTRRVRSGVAEGDEDLIQHDLVEDRRSQRRADPQRSRVAWRQLRSIISPAPRAPASCKRGPYFDTTRAAGEFRRVVCRLARRRLWQIGGA